VTPHL